MDKIIQATMISFILLFLFTKAHAATISPITQPIPKPPLLDCVVVGQAQVCCPFGSHIVDKTANPITCQKVVTK